MRAAAVAPDAHRLADLAGGNGVSASTISRWTREIIGLLAARAPRLDRALAAIKKEGGEAVLLDGTLIPTRRRSGPANRSNYSGPVGPGWFSEDVSRAYGRDVAV